MIVLETRIRRVAVALVLAVATAGFAPSGLTAEAARLSVAQAADPSDGAWSLVRDTVDPAIIQRFLVQYPDSPHAAEARARLDLLNDRGAPILPGPGPQSEPEAEPEPASTLAIDLQRELKRVGCYTGGLDGDWGPRSRRSLAEFGEATGKAFGAQPSAEALAAVKVQVGRVCAAATVPSTSAPGGGGGTSSGAGCYNVFVTVDTFNPQGRDWDPWAGNVGNPDPKITETTTGASSKCGDTFSCSLRVSPAGSSLNFTIVDIDPDRADPIGSGTCQAGRSCRLGSASLTMSAC